MVALIEMRERFTTIFLLMVQLAFVGISVVFGWGYFAEIFQGNVLTFMKCVPLVTYFAVIAVVSARLLVGTWRRHRALPQTGRVRTYVQHTTPWGWE